MRASLLLPAAVLLICGACQSDNGIRNLCGTPEKGFDITEASVLQDAQGYRGMHDAVILDYDDSELPEGAAWRVGSVEIMPMIAGSDFENFVDGQEISVEVWDADNPDNPPWKLTKTFIKDEHEWSTVALANPTEATEQEQYQTWWFFGFKDIIPLDGMSDTRFMVSVVWEDDALPTMGYSNFNRDCQLNWTDYNNGVGWVLNEGQTGRNECSWPMLRINMEVLEEMEECVGADYGI